MPAPTTPPAPPDDASPLREQLDALRESGARWRGLFERMVEGFFVGQALRDAAGRMTDVRFVEANPAFERLTGIPVTQALGRPVREATAGVQDELIAAYAQVVDTGQLAELEVRVPALNDRWYEARAIGHDRFSVLFLEITQRKAAETALVLRREALPPHGRRGAADRLDHGRRRAHPVLQPPLVRLYGADGLPRQRRRRGRHGRAPAGPRADHGALQPGPRHGHGLRGQHRIRGASGQYRWFLVRAEPYADPASGQGTQWYGSSVDIHDRKLAEESKVALLFTGVTQRKHAERALREADARKDEFLATLAHELRNPLAPISNGLAILRHADAASPAGWRARALMERQLAQLVRLVDDLLDVSRVSQGKVDLRRAIVPLHAVVSLRWRPAAPSSRPGTTPSPWRCRPTPCRCTPTPRGWHRSWATCSTTPPSTRPKAGASC